MTSVSLSLTPLSSSPTSSSTPSTWFMEKRVEFERYYWTTRQWSTRLLPTDRDSNIITTHRFDPASIPINEYAFLKDKRAGTWFIMADDPARTDPDGWQYAVDFPHFDSTAIWASVGPHNKGRFFVRRRIHLCKIVPRAYKLPQFDTLSPESSPTSADAKSAVAAASSSTSLSPTSAAGPTSASGALSPGRRHSITSDPKPLLTLRVVNKTDRSIWVGVYEGDDQLARIAVMELKVRSEWELKNLGGMTQAAASLDANAFPEFLGRADWDENPRLAQIVPQGILDDDTTVNMALRADGTLDARGKTEQAFSEVASWLRSQQVRLDDVRTHPCYAAHWEQKAKLRVFAHEPLNRKLGDEERKYVEGRKPFIKASMEKFLGMPLADDEVPTVAFAYSGGGVRAFIAAIGYTRAAIELGLYDCVTWSGGVSGGAWFECLWTQFNGNFEAFRSHMRQAFTGQPFVQGPKALRAIYRATVKQSAFKPGYNTSLADVYGNMLGYEWTQDGTLAGQPIARLDYTISCQAPLVVAKNKPVPVYTFVRAFTQKKRAIDSYEWHEMTPYEVTAVNSQVAMPTWAFARQWSGGETLNFAPEPSLPVMMGLFGSAFCASLEEMDRAIAIPTVLKTMLKSAGKSRLIGPPTFHDFHFNLDASTQAILEAAADKAGPIMHRMISTLGLDDDGDSKTSDEHDPRVAYGSPMAAGAALARQPTLGVDPTQPPDPSESSSMSVMDMAATATAASTAAMGPSADLTEHKQTADSKTAFAVAGAMTAAAATGRTPTMAAKGAVRWVESMTLVDAGVCVNAPLPSFFRPERRVDVVFTFDARPTEPKERHPNCSKDVLEAFVEFATDHGLKIPPIAPHLPGIGMRPLTVITDVTNPTLPTIAYMPCVANGGYNPKFDPQTEGFTGFKQFTYKPKNFDMLEGLTYYNMMQSKEAIKTLLINEVLVKRRAKAFAREALMGMASTMMATAAATTTTFTGVALAAAATVAAPPPSSAAVSSSSASLASSPVKR